MATGPLRFRTPFIEELPTTHTRQAPGFAWVAVAGPAAEDPSKNWGTTNRKRVRTTVPTAGASEATTARHRAHIDKKIKELNTDGVKDVAIPKRDAAGGVARAGKTSNTKKILTSGKTFAHYLDDEEAEIALRGRRDWDAEAQPTVQRASKTPIARRKSTQQLAKEEGSGRSSPAPSADVRDGTSGGGGAARGTPVSGNEAEKGDVQMEDAEGLKPPLPTQAEMDALLNALPLTYKEARSAPPPADAPPPRKFCEICGYWGRVRCMKCGNLVCSVMCKDAHDEHKCLKFYA